MRFNSPKGLILLSLLLGIFLPTFGGLLVLNIFEGRLFPWRELHSAIETIGGFIAISLGGFIFASMKQDEVHDYRKFMICGLVIMGILDILHAGFPPGKTFVWLHSSAQFFGGLFFALTLLTRDLHETVLENFKCRIVSASILTLAIATIVWPSMIPEMIIDKGFTLTAFLMNTLGGFGFILASVFFISKYTQSKDPNDHYFAIHCSLFGMAGILFDFSILWDAAWWWWHLLRLLAYSIGLFIAIQFYRATHKELLLIKKELERSNQDLEAFALVASHDMQEPIRKIQVFSERIEEIGPPLSNDQSRLLQRVNFSAQKMVQLIQDLLKYSRVSTEPSEWSLVDLNKRIKYIKYEMENLYQDIQASFKIGPLPSIYGDPILLEQLFRNLLTNSFKFSRPKETLNIEVSSKKLESGRWIIQVKDNGTGFDAEQSCVILEPFIRAHNPNQFPGSGLGLAICNKIMKRFGGTLSAYGKPGEGATFSLSFPENQAPASKDRNNKNS